MKLDVKKISGEDSGRKVELPADIFGITPNDHAVYLAVKAERANKRHGTHNTLERSAVSGHYQKTVETKGTGGARAGSVKTPLWPGGAITFGPHPHLYKKDTNVKVKRLARKSALTYKANDSKILVVEDFHTLCAEAPKTKSVFEVLTNLGLVSETKKVQKVLMLVDKDRKDEKEARAYDNFKKSCRNIPGLKVSVTKNASTYEIMNADYVLFHETALKNVATAFGAAAE